jgi:UDP-GlcNAc3NAcA epimerase
MNIVSIVGARPQFIKLAALVRAIDHHNVRNGSPTVDHRIVHTGQHYDAVMSDVFFDELALPAANFRLPACPGTQAQQTAAMLTGVERVLDQQHPDLVVVYGDTNSTLAGALAATKLHIPVAHVEAGLRSFNRRMPEEINRLIADHICDLLLAPTATAMRHLAGEGLCPRSVLTGDLMHDSVLHYLDVARNSSDIVARLALARGEYALATLHRADNTDDVTHLATLLTALNEIAASSMPVVLPLHPRTSSRIQTLLPQWIPNPHLRLIEPVGYLDMLSLLDHARIALTDSGGLQKEAFFIGCPCITLRTETEWMETVEAGANILTGADSARIRAAVVLWSERYPHGSADFSSAVAAAFGRNDAGSKTLDALLTLGGWSSQMPDGAQPLGASKFIMEGIRG